MEMLYKMVANLLKAEFKRTFLNNNINKFYVFSTILWPILSLIHVLYNLSVFPIKDIKINELKTENEILFFIFIGYCVYIIFTNSIRTSYNFIDERYQGTLGQVFMSPINKVLWIYLRTISQIISTSWFFLILFFLYTNIYLGVKYIFFKYTIYSLLVLLICSWVWTALVSSICIILRDSSIFLLLVEGAQATFSGQKVPLSISPKVIRYIGSFIPMTYTIIYMRTILIDFSILNINLFIFLLINSILIISSIFIIKYGEKYLRDTGNFDIY